jgi:FkbM family methyltransferase
LGARPAPRRVWPGALEAQLVEDRVDLVLDVGANSGQYVRMLRRLGYRGEVLSFEPNPGLAAALEHEARADGAWQVAQLALGTEPATLTLHVTRDPSCASLRAPSHEALASGPGCAAG